MVNSISTCDRRAEAIPEKNFVGLKFFPNFLNNLTKSAFTASNQMPGSCTQAVCVRAQKSSVRAGPYFLGWQVPSSLPPPQTFMRAQYGGSLH